jgi:tRNA1(Val) A37 N6-methylase TrmN6
MSATAWKTFSKASADLVLCNPPFHQQRAVGDQIAQRMFRQARDVLRPDGELWVIGNRHLGYHVALKRLFGRVELVASNAKFVVLASELKSVGERHFLRQFLLSQILIIGALKIHQFAVLDIDDARGQG